LKGDDASRGDEAEANVNENDNVWFSQVTNHFANIWSGIVLTDAEEEDDDECDDLKAEENTQDSGKSRMSRDRPRSISRSKSISHRSR